MKTWTPVEKIVAVAALVMAVIVLSADPKWFKPVAQPKPHGPAPKWVPPAPPKPPFKPYKSKDGVLMSSTGPLIVGTAAEDTGYGSEPWTNISNITATDGSFATNSTTFGTNTSNYIVGTNPGFSIAADQIIDGIEVTWRRQCSGSGSVTDDRIRIVKGGVIGSTERSAGAGWTSGSLNNVTFGGPSDLWGETWTYGDINDSGFGAALACVIVSGAGENVEIDSCSITVYHHSSFIGGGGGKFNKGAIMTGLVNEGLVQ